MPTPKRIQVRGTWGHDTPKEGSLQHTDIGQAIIAYVENHKGARRPLWLQGIYRELKKHRKELNRN